MGGAILGLATFVALAFGMSASKATGEPGKPDEPKEASGPGVDDAEIERIKAAAYDAGKKAGRRKAQREAAKAEEG